MGSKGSKEKTCNSRRESVNSNGQDDASSEYELSDPREMDVTGVNFLVQKLNLNATITCCDISDDCSMLVVGREDGQLEVFSTFSKECVSLAVLRAHADSITCCKFNENSIFSGSADSTIIKWSILSMAPVYVYKGHSSKVNKILIVDNLLFSSGYDKTAKVWYADPPGGFESFENSLDVNRNERTEQRASLTVSESDVEIEEEFYPRKDPLLLCTLTGHEKSVYPIQFIPAGDNWNLRNRQLYDRDLVVTGSADCTGRVWSIAQGECLHELLGHTAPIFSIQIGYESNNTIFTAGGDGNIHSYCPITGELLQRLIGHEGPILTMVTFKNMLYTGSTDRTARSWVMEFGEETRVFRGNHAAVNCISFFESLIFTGSEDGTVRVFDSKSGALLRTFKDTTDQVVGPVVDLQNVPGKVFCLSTNGYLSVWNCKGVKVESGFGETQNEFSDSEDSELDSFELVQAMNVLEKFLRKR